MPGRAPRRPPTRGRSFAVRCLAAGVGLVAAGLAFGLLGQLIGEPQRWALGAVGAALGVVLTAVGGVAMLVTRSKEVPDEERP